MEREILTHRGTLLNDNIEIIACGQPTVGGACRLYEISRPQGQQLLPVRLELRFQNGNPADEINGLSNEALLAVLIDRTEGWQNGPFASVFNAEALKHLKAAMSCYQARTADRVMRCVEGTQTP